MQVVVTDKQFSDRIKQYAKAAKETGYFEFFSYEQPLDEVVFQIKDTVSKDVAFEALKKIEIEIFGQEQLHPNLDTVKFRQKDEIHKMAELSRLAKETGLFSDVTPALTKNSRRICTLKDGVTKHQAGVALAAIEREVFGHTLSHDYNTASQTPRIL